MASEKDFHNISYELFNRSPALFFRENFKQPPKQIKYYDDCGRLLLALPSFMTYLQTAFKRGCWIRRKSSRAANGLDKAMFVTQNPPIKIVLTPLKSPYTDAEVETWLAEFRNIQPDILSHIIKAHFVAQSSYGNVLLLPAPPFLLRLTSTPTPPHLP